MSFSGRQAAWRVLLLPLHYPPFEQLIRYFYFTLRQATLDMSGRGGTFHNENCLVLYVRHWVHSEPLTKGAGNAFTWQSKGAGRAERSLSDLNCSSALPG